MSYTYWPLNWWYWHENVAGDDEKSQENPVPLPLQQWPELAFTGASACLRTHVLCVDYKQAFLFVDSTHSFPDNMSTRMSNKRNVGARTRKNTLIRCTSAAKTINANGKVWFGGRNAAALFFPAAPVVKIDCSPERCGQKERESSSRVGVNPRVSQISPPINLWPRYQERAHKQHFFCANARGDDSTGRYINNAKCNYSDGDIIIIYFYNGSCRHYGALSHYLTLETIKWNYQIHHRCRRRAAT